MGAGELVAISRLLKYTGKAISQLINSEEGQMVISDIKKGAKAVTDNAIKPATQKGKELYSDHVVTSYTNHIVASYMKQLRKKVDLLMILESRSKDDEGIIIADEEIKKLITMCDNPAILDDVLLKYLLMVFAVKYRGMINYIKDVSETRTYIDMVFADIVDESILNVKTIDEISTAIRLWITIVINNALDKLEEYEESKKQLKEEQIKNKEELNKKNQEQKQPKKETSKTAKQELSSQEIFLIIGLILGVAVLFARI